MKTFIVFAAVALLWFHAAATAQVPQLINYQGRVAVAGVNFDGVGQFKFALVNAEGGTTFWGNAPDTTPADGVPDAAVSLTVAKGLYAVLLGDASVPNMAALPASVFTNSDVRLRVWFNDGSHGWQMLTPDQRIAAVGYAMMAGNVPDSAITSAKLASGAVTASSIANGAVGASQLATGAAAANLNAGGQSGIASGGMILSADASNGNLLNAGYVKLGRVDLGDVWETHAGGAGLATRSFHTAVWTGSEMIVWGGDSFTGGVYTAYGDGGRYNPASNSWTAVATAGAPSTRSMHTAVWTGSEMIVWGGAIFPLEEFGDPQTFADGSRYNPISNSWTAVAALGAPSARADHTAVWTGSEMIIWGGFLEYFNGSYYTELQLNDGARFSPTTNSWTAVASAGTPTARDGHSAIWTGSQMVVWGGSGPSGFLNSGALYNPSTNSWVAVTSTIAPSARAYHTAVWTGSEMIVWGGFSNVGPDCPLAGGRFNPTANSWTALTTTGSPAGRYHHSAVWSGSVMIVWGGFDQSSYRNDGGIYQPAANAWVPTATTAAPSPRTVHTAVWTGDEMIVWGGYDDRDRNDGGCYNLIANSWSSVTTGVPSARALHTAVWTGSEMIVWGGFDASSYRNDGGRYNPAANSWTALTTTAAPSARSNHAAVWTGSEMIIWGGYFNATSPTWYRDGARYNPTSNTWTAVTTTGAPAARYDPSAVWTGSEMILWGGNAGLPVNDGGRYNPTTNSWLALPTSGAPTARAYHTAVWTGSEMILWGGSGSTGNPLSDGARFNPTANSWSATTPTGAPSARFSATAAWTGSQMIVWGGRGSSELNDGACYNPVADTWTAVGATGAPAARAGHSAVWTGSEMIIWGGRAGGSYLNVIDSGRYNPASNSWTAVTTVGAPAGRYWHTAVWTGTEMLVWGGRGNGYLNDTFGYTPTRSFYLYQRP